ncbi:hypothetical protein S7711_09971 [Stachybotrys chartarum IBT 7711]|uniref:Helicase C-terminal domain-containing protein n=1 Tax=Stachybotrys chartarum (strain CBS 109288 / IBT 7711) TaxID=1280523 RepID=A0A084B1W9_STACB|nr:hypothetical protein S7711_09971 [Stachybotrys chartarum IBT 7711]
MAANMCPYKHPVDPTNRKHYGLLQRCHYDHPYLESHACTLDRVSWVLFGPHQTPRSCREWAATGIGAMPLNEWMMGWDKFVGSVGPVDTATLLMKLPSHEKPFPVSGQDELWMALGAYRIAMQNDPAVSCLAQPPVVVILAQNQLGSFLSHNWPRPHPGPPDAGMVQRFGKPTLGTADSRSLTVALWGESSEMQTRSDSILSDVLTDTIASLPDEEVWPQVCAFFLHDPAEHSTGVRLPGTDIVLRAYQMVDAWRMLRVACSRAVNGTYNASSPGLGKTYECMAVAAVVALAAMSKEHCDRFPELHADQPRASCGDPRRFGIPCFCQGDRLTSALANLPPSPSLIIAPAGIISQWQTSWREFFADQVVSHQGETLSSHPLVSMVVARQQQLRTQSAFAEPVERKHLQPRFAIHPGGPSPPTPPSPVPATLADFARSKLRRHFDARPAHPHPALAGEQLGSDARRFMVISSSTSLSNNAFANMFQSEPLPVATGSRPLVLSGCFLPSAVFVDEFTENKGAGTNFVKALTAMVSTSIAATPRPIVSLLSGTPITTGLKDLEGTYPLVDRRGTLLAPLGDLVEAAKKLQSADTEDAVLEVRGRLQPLARDVLGVCMFFRTFNQPFLGGRVPDPRPDIWVHDRLHCPIPPRFEAKVSEKVQAMRRAYSDIMERYKSHKQRHNQLVRSREFGLNLVCSVLPGAVNVPDDWVEGSCKGGILDRGSAPGWIRDIQCGQLDAVEAHCRLLAGGAVARHSMVLAMKPRVAILAALYLRTVLPGPFTVVLVTAADIQPKDRSDLIQHLHEQSIRRRARPIVVVSTYGLMGMGTDGLQRFVSHIVHLGSPQTDSMYSQSICRVHRSRQENIVYVVRINGAVGSLDWTICQVLEQRKELVSIIGQMLGVSSG